MLKNKIKSIFLALPNEKISSKFVSLLCNEDIKKVERIFKKLENEDFIK